MAGGRSRALAGRRPRTLTRGRSRALAGRGTRPLARGRAGSLPGGRHRRTALRRHRSLTRRRPWTLTGRGAGPTPGGIGVSTATWSLGYVGTPSGVATARFVATRVVVVGTHVQISSNFGGRVSREGIRRAIVSFTRGSTVRLAGTRSGTTGLLRCGDGPEDIRLDEMVPAARAADLDHMDRELLLGRRETDQFVGRSR